MADNAAPFPSPADVGFLMFPIGVAVGLWMFPTSQPPGIRLRNVLDGVVVASALLAISWWTVLRTIVDTDSGDWLGLAVSSAYPIGDVLFIAMVVYSLTRPGPYRRTQMLLAAAMTSMAVADTTVRLPVGRRDVRDRQPLDLGWVIAFVLIAVTALWRPAGRDRR